MAIRHWDNVQRMQDFRKLTFQHTLYTWERTKALPLRFVAQLVKKQESTAKVMWHTGRVAHITNYFNSPIAFSLSRRHSGGFRSHSIQRGYEGRQRILTKMALVRTEKVLKSKTSITIQLSQCVRVSLSILLGYSTYSDSRGWNLALLSGSGDVEQYDELLG